MSGTIVDDVERREMIALHMEGYDLGEIAAMIGRSRHTVSSIVDDFLIVRLAPKKKTRPKKFDWDKHYKYWIGKEIERSFLLFAARYGTIKGIK